MDFNAKDKKLIICILFVALVSVALWGLRSFGFPEISDGLYYNEVASNVLAGKGLTYRGEPSDTAPGFMLFLSAVYYFFGDQNYDAARAVQVVLFLAAVALIYVLGLMLFNRKTAILASLFASLFYGLAVIPSQLHKELLLLFFVMVLTMLLYKSQFSSGIWWSLAIGAVLGALTLTAEVTKFLFIPISVVMPLVYRERFVAKEILFKLCVFLLVYGAVLGGWSLFNVTHNNMFATQDRTGMMLSIRAEKMENVSKNYAGHLMGNLLGYYFAEKAYPEIDPRAFINRFASSQRTRDLRSAGYSPDEVSSILQKESIAKITTAPHKYLFMALLDFIHLNGPFLPNKNMRWVSIYTQYTFAEGRHPELPGWFKGSLILGFRAIWLAFFLFVIYGAHNITKKNWRLAIWFLLIALYFNAVYAAVHALPRYALPIYPLYILLFAYGVVEVADRFTRVAWFIKFKDMLPFKNGSRI